MLDDKFGENEIAEIAASMAATVHRLGEQAAALAADVRRRIADGVALRNRRLDTLYAALVQAKAVAGDDALAQVEIQRRKAFVVLCIDGVVCLYVSVDDGLGSYGQVLRSGSVATGNYAVNGDDLTLRAARKLSGVDRETGLAQTLDLLGAFVALWQAGVRRPPPNDLAGIVDHKERSMVQ
jgi:hypothetical protein